jgi:hypothetical protein
MGSRHRTRVGSHGPRMTGDVGAAQQWRRCHLDCCRHRRMGIHPETRVFARTWRAHEDSCFLRRHYPDGFDGRRPRQPDLSPCRGTRVDAKAVVSPSTSKRHARWWDASSR